MPAEWSDFRVLLALARAGSVAGAARELQVDGSTISRRLAALEVAVKARLLIRGGRDFTWTAPGRRLIEAAQAMACAADAALRDVRAAVGDVAGTVRVSIAPAFVPLVMRHLLPELHAAYALLKVELQSAFHRADLARGEADIAVRMARPDEPDLIARRGFDCGWFVYASRAYLRQRGRPGGVCELAQHRLVLYSESLHSAPPTRWLEAYNGAQQPTSRVDSVETACQLALAAGGMAVLPAFIGDEAPELERVFAERATVNTGWVVYHEAMRHSARVKCVADALVDFFGARGAQLSGLAQAPSVADDHPARGAAGPSR